MCLKAIGARYTALVQVVYWCMCSYWHRPQLFAVQCTTVQQRRTATSSNYCVQVLMPLLQKFRSDLIFAHQLHINMTSLDMCLGSMCFVLNFSQEMWMLYIVSAAVQAASKIEATGGQHLPNGRENVHCRQEQRHRKNGTTVKPYVKQPLWWWAACK